MLLKMSRKKFENNDCQRGLSLHHQTRQHLGENYEIRKSDKF